MLLSLIVSAQFAVNCPNPRVRKDFRQHYWDGTWDRIVDAYHKMKLNGRMTYYAKLHADMFSKIHNNLVFYTWHRAFQWEFENEIRAIGGQDLTLPYIDWAYDAEQFQGAVDNSVANHPYFYAQQNGQCLAGRIFANSYSLSSTLGSQHTCLWRETDTSVLGSSWADLDSIMYWTPKYSDFSDAIQYGVHANVHIRFGGEMNEHFSPIDPLFFGHHGFVDLLLNTWQYMQQNYNSMSGFSGASSSFVINGHTYKHSDVFAMKNICVQYQRWGKSYSSQKLFKRDGMNSTQTSNATTTANATQTSTPTAEATALATSTETEMTYTAPNVTKYSNEDVKAFNDELAQHYSQMQSIINKAVELTPDQKDKCKEKIVDFYKNGFLALDNNPSPDKIEKLGLDPAKYKAITEEANARKLDLSAASNGAIVAKKVSDVIQQIPTPVQSPPANSDYKKPSDYMNSAASMYGLSLWILMLNF
eukprot:NODE_66_length_25735_cov_0.318497.p5 type:complete len:474 gc:universal NODE_66_length_25735_cov_0.318497:12571-11150(-)